MKNILYIIAVILLISCSKNEEEAINPLQDKLVGSWRFVGFFHYDIDMPGGEYFEPYPNGTVYNYYDNNSFETFGTLDNNPYTTNGTYFITAQDSIIEFTFNPNNASVISKITKLTNTTLEISPNEPVGIDNHLSISRYERIITP